MRAGRHQAHRCSIRCARKFTAQTKALFLAARRSDPLQSQIQRQRRILLLYHVATSPTSARSATASPVPDRPSPEHLHPLVPQTPYRTRQTKRSTPQRSQLYPQSPPEPLRERPWGCHSPRRNYFPEPPSHDSAPAHKSEHPLSVCTSNPPPASCPPTSEYSLSPPHNSAAPQPQVHWVP